jgi:hypothetical protein
MTTPVCLYCLRLIQAGGTPDFAWHEARLGESCGATDHEDNLAGIEEVDEESRTFAGRRTTDTRAIDRDWGTK